MPAGQPLITFLQVTLRERGEGDILGLFLPSTKQILWISKQIRFEHTRIQLRNPINLPTLGNPASCQRDYHSITRLHGAVPQPLLLLLNVFGYITFLRLSSIFKNVIVLTFNCFGCITFFEVVFNFQKNWGRLP